PFPFGGVDDHLHASRSRRPDAEAHTPLLHGRPEGEDEGILAHRACPRFSTSTDRPATDRSLPAVRDHAPSCTCGSSVVSTTVQMIGRVARGRVKVSGSALALKSRRKVSSETRRPWSSHSRIASPPRRMPKERVKRVFHSLSVIS